MSVTELKTFAGSGGYETIWHPYHDGSTKLAGFNRWAAILGVQWFFYRKLYMFGVGALIGDVLLLGGTPLIATAAFGPKNGAGIALILGCLFLWRSILGFAANVLYYRKAVKTINVLSELNVTNEEYLQRLATAGGVSIGAVFGLLFAGILARFALS